MTTGDVVYVAGIASVLALDHLVLWRTFLRRSQADPAKARTWVWTCWIVMLWAMVGAGVVLWVLENRAWEVLGFVVPQGWRLVAAIGLVLAVGILFSRSTIKVARIPSSRKIRVRDQLGEMAIILPHSMPELRLFLALSISAGICEEFIFRGYLIWAFKPIIGLWGAAALSAIAFGLAHAYQGAKGILKTGVVGVLFTFIVLGTGSLYPAIVLHALIDMGQGLIAWLALREAGQERESPVSPELSV